MIAHSFVKRSNEMARSAQDVLGVLRGLQIVAEACGREHLSLTKHLWSNSSVRELISVNVTQTVDALREASEQPADRLRKAQELIQETGERGYVVAHGLCQLLETKLPSDLSALQRLNSSGSSGAAAGGTAAGGSTGSGQRSSRSHLDGADAATVDISSITLLEFEEILSKRNMNRNVSLRTPNTQTKQLPSSDATSAKAKAKAKAAAIPPTPIGGDGILNKDTEYVDNLMRFVAGSSTVAAAEAAEKKGRHAAEVLCFNSILSES